MTQAILTIAYVSFIGGAPLHIANAQTWTQITTPSVGNCYYGTTTTNGCVMGTSTEPSSQPSPPSPSNPDIIYPPGVGTNSMTQGEYVGVYDGYYCAYPDGSPQMYNGPNIWWGGGVAGTPVVAIPAYWLYSAYQESIYGGYGLEFNVSFQGSTSPTNSGLASIYFGDSYCGTGDREYGIAYNYNTGGLQLYWNTYNNCGASSCYLNSELTERAPAAVGNGCVIKTGSGGISPSTAYIYDIYFTSSGGTNYVNCIIKSAATEEPLTTNYFTGPSNFTFNSTTGVFSGPLDSGYAPPVEGAASSAGYYIANTVSEVLGVTDYSAAMKIGWIKVAK
jgi:hypothetical protein